MPEPCRPGYPVSKLEDNVLGVASAASANRTFTGPIADQRPTGFSSPVPVYGKHF